MEVSHVPASLMMPLGDLKELPKWVVKVFSNQQPVDGESEVVVELTDAGGNVLQVTNMQHGGNEGLRRRGIVQQVIVHFERLGHRLQSSTNSGKELVDGEFRSPDADRVWKKLVGRNLADYDEAEHRYILR